MPKDVEKSLNKETENQESEKGNAAETQREDFKKINADEIVKPYIDRITKEQAKKNDYKTKYENALKELDQLKNNGGKTAKEISEEDDRAKELKALKEQNQALNAKIAHEQTIKDVNGIFKKADLNVSDDVLNMVANSDAKITASNAKAIINLVNEARESGRNSILKGKTPKASGSKPDANDISKALGL